MTNTIATAVDPATHLVSDTHGVRYEPDPRESLDTVEVAHRTGRIVVGVDGSEASIAALREGVRIAEALGSSVEAITTWRQPAGYAEYIVDYTPEGDAKSIVTGAEQSVFPSSTPAWFTIGTFEGPAADVLIEQSRGAAMLVVGSRGHGGIAGMLIGSVSAKCAEYAHCPVLVIH